jgi:hypothetical protein
VALPLMLAGPILRRVEPELVTVWVALSRAASLKLTLWEERVKAGSPNPHASSDPATTTLRVGERLHIAAVTLKIAKTSAKLLKPGRLYAYDLEITETAGGAKHTLSSLGLLKNGKTTNGDAAATPKDHLALGYDTDVLPNFALPPEKLEDLRIAYGSCRRVANSHDDAMVWLDDLLQVKDSAGKRRLEDPLQRFHQLFLGGDQIYADDVSPLHLQVLNRLGKSLIGTVPLPADHPSRVDLEGSIEHLLVDHVLERVPGAGNPIDLARDYRPTAGTKRLRADLAEFPAGRRFDLTTIEAQMTSVDGESHLLSVGEFAAMYVSVWSNACWPEPNQWPAAATLRPPLQGPPLLPQHLDAPLDVANAQVVAAHDKRIEAHVRLLNAFAAGLPKVRRALANIPTYMIFDDHDVTDDWNLNPTWCDRVMTTSLGGQTVRNALATYALFQDWGNDPLKYEKGEPLKLLDAVSKLFPQGATQGPAVAAAEELDRLFGLKLRPQPSLDGRFDTPTAPMTWHFSIGGSKHLAVALDNRTRRSFASRNGPPGNVSNGPAGNPAAGAQAAQVPAAPLADGREVLIVVAPLQVLAPSIFDEIIAPGAYRAFDALAGKAARSDTGRGTDLMAGTNPDAIEGWALDAPTFEALLKRLAAHKKVVILSGDVHYSAATQMSYWRKGEAMPARLVQFTSSGMKNVMPDYLVTIDHSLAFAQQMVRADVGAERLGWDQAAADAFEYPPGQTQKDVPLVLRKRLKQSPMMLPTYGWPVDRDKNPDVFTGVKATRKPDWSWRLLPVFDARPDAQRPKMAQPLAVDAAQVEQNIKGDKPARGYQEVAARHQRQLERLGNSRQILFRANLGIVRFERKPVSGGETLEAVQALITAFPDPQSPTNEPPRPEGFVEQRALLTPPAGELRPEDRPLHGGLAQSIF